MFLLCAEGLTALVQDVERNGLLHGCKVAISTPIVSNNDSFFFVRADIDECRVLKSLFATYELASGEVINFSKSGIFQ